MVLSWQTEHKSAASLALSLCRLASARTMDWVVPRREMNSDSHALRLGVGTGDGAMTPGIGSASMFGRDSAV